MSSLGLFGLAGRELLDRMAIPDPWRRNVDAALSLIDDLELRIAELTVELKRQGADHRYVPLLVTAPGLGWINAYTIASEIGDIERFPSPAKLCGYTALCPRVVQSGATDRRGPISKHGPRYLRWAPFEAAFNARKHPLNRDRYQRTKKRLGRQHGRRSRRSTSPESSPRPSGTCSPATNPSLRQAPVFVSPPDGSLWKCAAGASLPLRLIPTTTGGQRHERCLNPQHLPRPLTSTTNAG